MQPLSTSCMSMGLAVLMGASKASRCQGLLHTALLCKKGCVYLDAASCEEQERNGHEGKHHCDEQHAWHRQVQAAGGLLCCSWRRLLPCKHARHQQIQHPKLLRVQLRQGRMGLQSVHYARQMSAKPQRWHCADRLQSDIAKQHSCSLGNNPHLLCIDL